MSRPTGVASSRPYLFDADGPNLILMLFGVALLTGVLVGLGARSITRQDGDHPPEPEVSLSTEAAGLGYHTDWNLTADRKREAVALRQVLAGPPGTQRLWDNVETGNRGVIWAAPEVPRPDGGACRSLERRTLVNGTFRISFGTACHNARGVWQDDVAWRSE